MGHGEKVGKRTMKYRGQSRLPSYIHIRIHTSNFSVANVFARVHGTTNNKFNV